MLRRICAFFRPFWQYGLPLIAMGSMTFVIAFLEGGFGPFSAIDYAFYAVFCTLFLVPLSYATLGWRGIRLFGSLFVCTLLFVWNSTYFFPQRQMVHTMYRIPLGATKAEARAIMRPYTEEISKGNEPDTEYLCYWTTPEPGCMDNVGITLHHGRVIQADFNRG